MKKIMREKAQKRKALQEHDENELRKTRFRFRFNDLFM